MSDTGTSTSSSQQAAGPAMWGQDARYTAREDRLALTALAMGRSGIITPARLTAVPGTLTFTLDAGWQAVGDAGDGTCMVMIGEYPGIVTVLPGDDYARVDVLWAELYPAAGQWSAALLSEADLTSRPGVELGRVSVPPRAATADEMAISLRAQDFSTLPGPPGPQGGRGDQGQPGAGLLLQGRLGSPAELPPTGRGGMAYDVDGQTWVWTGPDDMSLPAVTVQGPPGPPGPPGSGFRFRGNVPSQDALNAMPTTGLEPGDTFFVEDTGVLVFWVLP